MKHTPQSRRITIRAVGVLMTASEANRQRVVKLLSAEEAQMCMQFNTFGKEFLEVKRGKPPMSEIRQPWTSGSRDSIQSIAS